MWFYLFADPDTYSSPLGAIEALAAIDSRGGTPYLKLTPHDDAPIEGAGRGDLVYFCTRGDSGWLIHAEARATGEVVRGSTPEDVRPIYGEHRDGHWWSRLGQVRLYDPPRIPADLGLAAESLPRDGQAHVIHLPDPIPERPPARTAEARRSALDRLTRILDEADERGNVAPGAIDAAIARFRSHRPYRR